ncbi:MAG: AlpA family phage regulatory protein [Xanthobacteraceae bacterium]
MNIEQILLTRRDLHALGIRVSNTTLLRWEHRGRFPRRAKLALTTVAWYREEVLAWLEERAAERSRHVYAEY